MYWNTFLYSIQELHRKNSVQSGTMLAEAVQAPFHYIACSQPFSKIDLKFFHFL